MSFVVWVLVKVFDSGSVELGMFPFQSDCLVLAWVEDQRARCVMSKPQVLNFLKSYTLSYTFRCIQNLCDLRMIIFPNFICEYCSSWHHNSLCFEDARGGITIQAHLSEWVQNSVMLLGCNKTVCITIALVWCVQLWSCPDYHCLTTIKGHMELFSLLPYQETVHSQLKLEEGNGHS